MRHKRTTTGLVLAAATLLALTGTATAIDLNSSSSLQYYGDNQGGTGLDFAVATNGATTLYGPLNMQNNEVTNFFDPTACGSGQVVDGLTSDGSYNCVIVDNEVTDNWVNETGDTMTGDLNMSTNTIDFTDGDELVGQIYGNSNRIKITHGTLQTAVMLDGKGLPNVITAQNADPLYIRREDGTKIASFKESGNVEIPTGNISVSSAAAKIQVGEFGTQNIRDNGTQILIQGQNSFSIGSYHSKYIAALTGSSGNINIPNGNLDLNGNEVQNVVSDSAGDAVNKSYVDSSDDTGTDSQTLSTTADVSGTNDQVTITNGNSITVDDDFEANTNAGTQCSAGQYMDGDGTCYDEYDGSDDGDTSSTNEVQALSGVLGQGNSAGTNNIELNGNLIDGASNTGPDLGRLEHFDMEPGRNTLALGVYNNQFYAADEKPGYSVSWNNPPDEGGSKASLFNEQLDSAARWNSSDPSNFPIVINITLPSQTNYWNAFGYHSPYGRYADNYTIEVYDSNAGQWKTVCQVTNDDGWQHLCKASQSYVTKIRYTFNSANNPYDQFRIGQLYGYNFYYGQTKSALDVRGGDLYGTLAMNNNQITTLADPTTAQDAATKSYVDSNDDTGTDDQSLSEVLVQGNVANTSIDIDNNSVTNVSVIDGGGDAVKFNDDIRVENGEPTTIRVHKSQIIGESPNFGTELERIKFKPQNDDAANFLVQLQDNFGDTNEDLFFQLQPENTGRYSVLESWAGAGLVLGTGDGGAESGGPVVFRTDRTERARITESGNLNLSHNASIYGSGGLDLLNGDFDLNGNSVTNTNSLNFDTGVQIGYDTAGASAGASTATAIGYGASANSANGVALGRGATADDSQATAIGGLTTAGANPSLALGYGANASAANALAIGASVFDATTASAEGAVAIGHSAQAPNPYEATFGNLNGDELDVNVTGNLTVHQKQVFPNGIEIGDSSTTVGSNTESVAVGNGANASGNYASAFGDIAYAPTIGSSAFGRNAEASGDYSSAFGAGTVASYENPAAGTSHLPNIKCSDGFDPRVSNDEITRQ